MTARPQRLPQRVEPVHAQRLAVGDLRDLLELADHQRRRHVRALHRTWGIAAGLEVFRMEGPETYVGPGVAYDVCGRLLVVRATTPLPSDAPARPCMVALRADPAKREPGTIIRLLAEDELELGLDVPLARLPGGEGLPDLGAARHARSAAPVVMGAGRVLRGRAPASGTEWDWIASIDTSAAGFQHAPLYVAHVATSAPDASPAGVEIDDERRDGFTVHVRRAGPNTAAPERDLGTNPDELTWIAALPQDDGRFVGDPAGPGGPCAPAPTRGEP